MPFLRRSFFVLASLGVTLSLCVPAAVAQVGVTDASFAIDKVEVQQEPGSLTGWLVVGWVYSYQTSAAALTNVGTESATLVWKDVRCDVPIAAFQGSLTQQITLAPPPSATSAGETRFGITLEEARAADTNQTAYAPATGNATGRPVADRPAGSEAGEPTNGTANGPAAASSSGVAAAPDARSQQIVACVVSGHVEAHGAVRPTNMASGSAALTRPLPVAAPPPVTEEPVPGLELGLTGMAVALGVALVRSRRNP